ncbi:MAG: hypothetical protein COU68_00230 [Candidatus Pacebacteria bacterium CG10_big_fil_rev_8_21_14_0_10_45_6]|nr:MAG: hypothetical protein COU68_00230 [Candidatus Pacebacteria bacterium CG10_big_fil_rev_8_21_14_0_10_45_6]
MALNDIRKSTKVIFILFFVSFVFLQMYNKLYWPTADLQIGSRIITVEVAGTLYRQQKGLGGRDDINSTEGMLFPLDMAARHPVVMRDMRFSIDVVWIREGVVVDIAPELQPEPGVGEGQLTRYYPRAEANAILELPAGKAEEYGIKIGDRIEQAG